MFDIIFVDNSFAIELKDLKNSTTKQVDENAVVTFVIRDTNDIEVGGLNWPLTLNHQGGGTYIGVLESTVALVHNQKYWGYLTVQGSNGEVANWRRRIQASYRGNKD